MVRIRTYVRTYAPQGFGYEPQGLVYVCTYELQGFGYEPQGFCYEPQEFGYEPHGFGMTRVLPVFIVIRNTPLYPYPPRVFVGR